MRSEKRQKTKLIQVRATPTEKEKLKARAAAFGISMGELCRETIFGTTPKSKTDQDARRELAATRADLGRLGGLLKGWLAGSFTRSPPTANASKDIINLIKEIQESQKVVLDAAKKLMDKK